MAKDDKTDPRERITIQPKGATKENPRTTTVTRRAFEKVWEPKGYTEVKAEDVPGAVAPQVTEPVEPADGKTKAKAGSGS